MSSHTVVTMVYDSRGLIIFCVVLPSIERFLVHVCTLPQFVSSDHKPMIATFNEMVVNTNGYSPHSPVTDYQLSYVDP